MAIAYGRVLNALGVPWSVAGRGDGSAKAFQAACGIAPVQGGLEKYLRDYPVSRNTAAIVALPIPQLAKATRMLAEAGVERVLVEKPAGLDASEIDGVAQAAARTGTGIFVAYNRRFYAAVSVARAMIAEDGGATSFHMEFTEIESLVRKAPLDAAVLANWFLANSTHVIDLAFHLCGQPAAAEGMTAGSLAWHPVGAVFVGHGRTETGALFSWHADWSSAGRWGLDVRTARRRLLLQPLEQLSVQEKGSFAVVQHPLADELDRTFKPGLYRQVEAFLSSDPARLGLPTIMGHAACVRRWFAAICPPAGPRTAAVMVAS
ncbi:MAG: hypothetical protein QOF09_599 [Alphaproteobacteria bacterium]|nr:hypothetical protein [Alphaproteobacteria bacterium]